MIWEYIYLEAIEITQICKQHNKPITGYLSAYLQVKVKMGFLNDRKIENVKKCDFHWSIRHWVHRGQGWYETCQVWRLMKLPSCSLRVYLFTNYLIFFTCYGVNDRQCKCCKISLCFAQWQCWLIKRNALVSKARPIVPQPCYIACL